jgi:hypothetical protein
VWKVAQISPTCYKMYRTVIQRVAGAKKVKI